MMNRYNAQARIEEIGIEGQKRLRASHALIIGCGALGSPVAMYLAGAGVGRLTLVDFDNVDLSNLHRQVFYTEASVGESKVEQLASRVKALNSDVNVTAVSTLANRKYLESLEELPDVVIDCADNPATTFMLDDYCASKGIPFVTAGISGWDAQIFIYLPGSPRYLDFITPPSEDEGVLPCSIAGITGPTAAYAASLMTSETLKILLGINKKSAFLTADLLKLSFSYFSI